jgi:hypothetical protein
MMGVMEVAPTELGIRHSRGLEPDSPADPAIKRFPWLTLRQRRLVTMTRSK